MLHLLFPTGSQPKDEDCMMMKNISEENEQLRREVQRLKEEKEQQSAVTHYDHPPRDNPPQIVGMLQPRSHDPTYPQSNIVQLLPTPGAGVHYVPQNWTDNDSCLQGPHHAPAPYHHATHTPGDLQTKQDKERARTVMVYCLTEENTQPRIELEQSKSCTTHGHQNNGGLLAIE